MGQPDCLGRRDGPAPVAGSVRYSTDHSPSDPSGDGVAEHPRAACIVTLLSVRNPHSSVSLEAAYVLCTSLGRRFMLAHPLQSRRIVLVEDDEVLQKHVASVLRGSFANLDVRGAR